MILLLAEVPVWIWIVLCGAIGGLARVMFTGGRNYRRIHLPNDEGDLIEFGWFGDIVVGGIAAFVIWSTGLGNPNPPASYGIAIVSGIVSSSILANYIDKQANRHIVKTLTDAMEKKVKKK